MTIYLCIFIYDEEFKQNVNKAIKLLIQSSNQFKMINNLNLFNTSNFNYLHESYRTKDFLYDINVFNMTKKFKVFNHSIFKISGPKYNF